MKGVKQVVLVRHGQSVINVVKEGRPFWRDDAQRKPYEHFEDGDFPLTELGMDQARKTGLALKEKYGKFDLVINSSYVRTKQTRDLILDAYSDEERKSMSVWETSIIRERSSGEHFKLTAAEVEEKYPGWNERWRATTDRFSIRIPGGESMKEICEGRLAFFHGNLLYYLEGENIKKILVVSHGRAIQGMRYLMERWDKDRIIRELKSHPENCSLTCYNFDEEKNFNLEFYNQVFY